MAKSASRKNAKAATPPKPTSRKPRPTGLPPPFESPSQALTTHFLPHLPKEHIYLLSLDSTVPSLKRQVFYAPIALNLFITLLILLRLYYAIPMYADLVWGLLGHSSPTVVDVQSLTKLTLAGITVRRTLMLLGDYLLFTLFAPWPWRFVFGLADTRYSSPLKWRRAVRFQDREIIVRRSRDWGQALLPEWITEESDDVTLKTKILPALEKAKGYLGKTGYALEDRDWGLDFAGMIHAHNLVSDAKLSLGNFEESVLVHQVSLGWMIWPVTRAASSSSTVSASNELQTTKQRETLLRFQEKLTSMGHEDLFYRWVELVQYESTSPQGFTREKQANAMREAKKIFEEKGVDFEAFWKEVGGMEGMEVVRA